MSVAHLIILAGRCLIISFSINLNIVDGKDLINNTSNNSNISLENPSVTTNLSYSSSTSSKNVSHITLESGQVLSSAFATKMPTPVSIDTTHMGRENVVESNKPIIVNSANTSRNNSINVEVTKNLTSATNKSVSSIENELTFDLPEKAHNKKSVPKKGVDTPPLMEINLNKTQQTAMQGIIKVKKPLFTEADNDAPFAPSNFVPKTQSNSTKIVVPEVPSIESITNKKNHRDSDYIVPIISVIFSVPLVAIIFSVLYKRLGEWWHHRHYRRMDFLIEGMYNN